MTQNPIALLSIKMPTFNAMPWTESEPSCIFSVSSVSKKILGVFVNTVLGIQSSNCVYFLMNLKLKIFSLNYI